jgi:membrane-bound ClpP family serine protease
MSARVETNLEPEGAIILKGELWRARLKDFSTPVGSGSTVRIVGVSGHLLVVEQTD